MSYPPLASYRKASEATSEINQLIMLYQGAINYIEQVKIAIERKDYESRFNLTNKASSIMLGLNACLEFGSKTDETAKALDEYYQTMDLRILMLNSNNSLAECDNIIRDLRVMLDAWTDIARENQRKQVLHADEAVESGSANDDDSSELKDITITV